jgi:hypothetical protein
LNLFSGKYDFIENLIQHNSIFLGRSGSGPIGPPLFHFYRKLDTKSSLKVYKVSEKLKVLETLKKLFITSS